VIELQIPGRNAWAAHAPAPVARVALVGNSLPRRCGIATFTTDLHLALRASRPGIETRIVAMNDSGPRHVYPSTVCRTIDAADESAYAAAAHFLNRERYDTVCLQHEFGIFGGPSGAWILRLLDGLDMPVVTTLHTILDRPTPEQRHTIVAIAARSARMVAMTGTGSAVLARVYGVDPEKIEIIPHGIPDVTFEPPDAPKAALGFAGRSVVLTFGLLSPNKGIETMIDAMPEVLRRRPDAVYVVLGATHPHLVREQGEAYRESLIARARALGIADRVVFVDRFVDRPDLLAHIAMCDVYVTPYLNEAQMTSGTLAYSYGSGRAVVSTPYWHARELLADGAGSLVPFADPAATAEAVADLLTDAPKRDAMRANAYRASREMVWARTGERYHDVFAAVRRASGPRAIVPPPRIRLDHFLSMCDDTGLLQHAIGPIADRDHGYSIDDNARGLLLACALAEAGEVRPPAIVVDRLAAYVQHAWNPATGRFRNFMGFDRRWLETQGSEDSHARALWALGILARDDLSPPRRDWAAALFRQALPAVEAFTAPRAWAFALLGLAGYCAAAPDEGFAKALRATLADRLMALLAAVETPGWRWFEEYLSYDNARLPQALIETGHACGHAPWREAGLRALRWLDARQTAPSGVFRPVGTESFGLPRQPPAAFDQQPLEAAATIAACLGAWRADGAPAWIDAAARAFDWFHGANDLELPLVDPRTGACRDGLHRDRANANRGGESVVSYLLAAAQMRALARETGAATPEMARIA
jgi:glycosyltransferase involved in cell wall biosynthesis